MRMLMTAVAAAGALIGAVTVESAQAANLDAPGVSVGASKRVHVRHRTAYRHRVSYVQSSYYFDNDFRDPRVLAPFPRGDCRIAERERLNRDGSVSVRRTQVCY